MSAAISYAMGGNPNSVYVMENRYTSSLAISTVFCIFLAAAVIMFYSAYTDACRGKLNTEEGAAKIKKRVKRGLFCIVGCVVMLGVYTVNPYYKKDQQSAADAAIEDIKERYNLDAEWEYVPYSVFNKVASEKRVGRLYIVDSTGERYPLKMTAATYEVNHANEITGSRTRTSDETFIGEVQTSSGYVPISEFAEQEAAKK